MWTVYHKHKNPALKPYTVVATKGVLLNQDAQSNSGEHNFAKRKINSSVQCGCKQCSLHKHNYLSLI